MPAPVPAGYTRGALVVLGAASTPERQALLLQRFWNEAGGYGARIVICATPGMEEKSRVYQTQLQQMEAESVLPIPIAGRQAARQVAAEAAIDQATGILLLAPTALHFAAFVGGTALATTIRRANAQGKAVAGAGSSAAILCQHMITPIAGPATNNARLQHDLIQFAPGLGMVNRLLLAIEPQPQPLLGGLAALLTAIAYNPFLVGVEIAQDTGLVIYPDTTLEVFGQQVVIVDGNTITHTDVVTAHQPRPLSLHGVQLHVLTHGQTYHFDTHTAAPQPPTDIPLEGVPHQHSF
ncbi:MAG: hypothetical protein KF832_14710 [Caldilineaceae bacterium]|nr:hypothetical protein [Caldilineaceae bacterium]